MEIKDLRLNLVVIFVFIIGGLFLCRLFVLQIDQGNFYKAIAQGQQVQLSEIEGKRGYVYFSNGEILAMNKEEPYLFISPAEIENNEEAVEEILKIIDVEKSFLLSLLEDENSFYKIVKKEIGKEKADKIKSLKLKGLYIGNDTKRYYPAEKTSSQIIGFVNQDKIGQYGIEGCYNETIKGLSSLEKSERNPFSFSFKGTNNDSLDGDNLTLTIDYNIQFIAEELLEEGMEEYDAEGGNIIVMNPNTGAIIAMAQKPNFDPNNYGNSNGAYFKNTSIQEIFEPGSIFKPITMAMAINDGAVTAETKYTDNLGYVQYPTNRVSNYSNKAWGEVNMTQVLENSINTGVIFAEKELGHESFYNYLEKFGIFEKTGIDLSGEVVSANNEIKNALKSNVDISFGTASFGQGIAMTPLQMINSFSAIINGGTLYKPYVVKKINNQMVEPKAIRENIISKETSTELKKMLISVVENGFGHLAKVEGYWIGGKTGTSQIPYSSLGINKAGYSDSTWQTFMGFAPALDPQFIVLVKLNNSKKIKTSEYSAVPIFNKLANYIFDYWQIPPDYLDKK
ncbi:MAG: penicillin-binding protein 2 [Candidatus Pacebacteria bacterium]|nr:penicillin-binding protein 2 [Candidatus Paceibacterota bacterium]MDD3970110.1 penicillin-binding protein 2 [Candidatus Paceibacterota bacterium]MDD4738118.1 penicillin-binding protein 2 [Candidatus Paceibacterota bacterium]